MKPRCSVCDSAMKNPYQRVGSKGKWDSINDWWYCKYCNRMENVPNITIEENPGTYLNEEAARIYPTIAKIRTETNATYVDLKQLMDVAKRRYNEWINYNTIKPAFANILISNYYQDDSIIKSSRPGWICSSCYNFEYIEDTMLLRYDSEEALKKIMPEHCGKKMKLGNVTNYLNNMRFDKIKAEIKMFLQDDEFENALPLLLEYVLELFSNNYFKRLLHDIVDLTNLRDDLYEYEEFQIIRYFLSIFSKKNFHQFLDVIKIGTINSFGMSLNIHFDRETRIQIINRMLRRFSYIKEAINRLDYINTTSKKWQFTEMFWKIEVIIESMISNGKVPDRSWLEPPISVKDKLKKVQSQ